MTAKPSRSSHFVKTDLTYICAYSLLSVLLKRRTYLINIRLSAQPRISAHVEESPPLQGKNTKRLLRRPSLLSILKKLYINEQSSGHLFLKMASKNSLKLRSKNSFSAQVVSSKKYGMNSALILGRIFSMITSYFHYFSFVLETSTRFQSKTEARSSRQKKPLHGASSHCSRSERVSLANPF